MKILLKNGPPPGFEIWEESERDDIIPDIFDSSKLPKRYLLEIPNIELIAADLKDKKIIPGAKTTVMKIKILRVK